MSATVDASNGQTAQAFDGRLVTVLRPSDSHNLIVCFNGYSRMAHARPDLPFETALMGLNWLNVFDANILWVAEEKPTWYLQHEETVISRIIDIMLERDIRAIKFIGSSAGAYASIRAGLLLDKALVERGISASIFAFAMNPQTGFRTELIERAVTTSIRTGWNPRLLGVDPILLADVYRDAYQHKLPDISDIVQVYKPKNFATILMYDSLNPIEQVFSGDILSAEWLIAFPKPLGVPHGSGCTQFWTEYLWDTFDRVAPFGKLSAEPTDDDLRLVA